MNELYSASKEKRRRKTENMYSKYQKLVEKCNSLHVSTICVVQLIDFNEMDSVIPA